MKHRVLFIFVVCLFTIGNLHSQNYVYPYSYNNQYGLVNNDNEKVIEPIYDKIGVFMNQKFNDFAVYMMKSIDDKPLFGLIDKSGNVKLEARFNFIKYRGNGRFAIVWQNSGFLEIIDIETGEKINQFKLGEYKIHNQMVVFKEKDADFAIILFSNNKELKFDSKYSLKYEIYQESKQCPFVEIGGKFYNCHGDEVNQDDVFKSMNTFHDQAVDKQNSSTRSRKKPLDPKIADKYSNHRSVVPIYNYAGELQSLILDKISLVNQAGEVLFEDEAYCSILLPYPDPFNHFNGLISCGYSNEQGLLNNQGKIILNKEFVRIVSFEEYAKRIPQIDYEYDDFSDILMVLHKSGYGGMATRNGRLFLPKDCNCLETKK